MINVIKELENAICQDKDCGLELKDVGCYWLTDEESYCAHCAEKRGYEI